MPSQHPRLRRQTGQAILRSDHGEPLVRENRRQPREQRIVATGDQLHHPAHQRQRLGIRAPQLHLRPLHRPGEDHMPAPGPLKRREQPPGLLEHLRLVRVVGQPVCVEIGERDHQIRQPRRLPVLGDQPRQRTAPG